MYVEELLRIDNAMDRASLINGRLLLSHSLSFYLSLSVCLSVSLSFFFSLLECYVAPGRQSNSCEKNRQLSHFHTLGRVSVAAERGAGVNPIWMHPPIPISVCLLHS